MGRKIKVGNYLVVPEKVIFISRNMQRQGFFLCNKYIFADLYKPKNNLPQQFADIKSIPVN
jgi:hypothetical protein